jgi:hypothetical protein|tara:strand:- start:254 stop:403 length:150 start_codon:yes stop_codon:yes gene_type:complete
MYQIQFREKGMKRFFDFSHRKLKTLSEGRSLLKVAKRNFPNRDLKLVKR